MTEDTNDKTTERTASGAGSGSVSIDIEELRKALRPISEAQIMLEDNYTNWNEAGKQHAIYSACRLLRDAHSRVSAIYSNAVYGDSPNIPAHPRRTETSNEKTNGVGVE